MSIKVSKTTKIYVACPANVATGGPELLHQLAYHIIHDLGLKAFMFYYNYDNSRYKTPVQPEYEHYNVPYVLEIPSQDDDPDNILVVPEIFSALKLLPKYRNMRKGVWFLSVDNYYFSRTKRFDFPFQKAMNKFLGLFGKEPMFDVRSENNLILLAKKYDYREDPLLKVADFYMAQSHRVMHWFRELKPMYYLSDYLNPKFLKIQPILSKKDNIVTFNPKKGLNFTKRIVSFATKDERFRKIEFVPIINMNRSEVIDTLMRAKVYIDFGNHPGKDRIPREAAILGCCIVTGKKGSAAFYEDVPISDKYKFEDKSENIPGIVEKIYDCIENFEERYKDFEEYREMIKSEPEKFIEDLKKIFVYIDEDGTLHSKYSYYF